MKRYGLAGYPLGHSFSAGYFAEKFIRLGLKECEYLNYPVTSAEKIRPLFEADPELMGLNVTIPYKKSVIGYIDTLDREAELSGSVNVIKPCRKSGGLILIGFNTDIFGFRESLPAGYRTGGGLAMVLGTGGASGAVRFALKEMGYELLTISREKERGDLTYDQVTPEIVAKSRLIVNSTPAGMHPDVGGAPPLDYDMLTGRQLLFDLVYNPAVTRFMREGTSRGCSVINGLRMLHLQADRAWEIWNCNDDPQ